MAPDPEDAPSPDAVLMAACTAARIAWAAYEEEARKAKPGKRLDTLFERERLAFECVAATRAHTPRGIAEKAILLEVCAGTTETMSLALSLASDGVALVRAMIGDGPARA